MKETSGSHGLKQQPQDVSDVEFTQTTPKTRGFGLTGQLVQEWEVQNIGSSSGHFLAAAGHDWTPCCSTTRRDKRMQVKTEVKTICTSECFE